MPRRRSPALTDGELRLMNVLWQRGQATVGDVVEALAVDPRPAYNTVLTMFRILEKKGYVSHEKSGRAFSYRPEIARADARRSALSHLLTRFFDGSPERLVLSVLGRDEAGEDELERVRALIARADTEPAAPRRPPR